MTTHSMLPIHSSQSIPPPLDELRGMLYSGTIIGTTVGVYGMAILASSLPVASTGSYVQALISRKPSLLSTPTLKNLQEIYTVGTQLSNEWVNYLTSFVPQVVATAALAGIAGAAVIACYSYKQSTQTTHQS